MTEETKKGVRAAKFSKDSIINLGTDDKGVAYGPENNPKRAGSEANKRFEKYENGMTIEQAMEAGVTRADINWDSKQGFITVTA